MSYLITGNTFPVRDRMRSLGGRWDRMDKGWRFSTRAAADQAQAIVDAVTPKPADPAPVAPAAPVQAAPAATDPVLSRGIVATAILECIVANLPPRKLADALIANGIPQPVAEGIAVRAAECARMPAVPAPAVAV